MNVTVNMTISWEDNIKFNGKKTQLNQRFYGFLCSKSPMHIDVVDLNKATQPTQHVLTEMHDILYMTI